MDCILREKRVLALFMLAFVTLSYSEYTEENLVLEPEPQVFQTKDGPVQGNAIKTADGQTINAIYGIPYARPPVGDLRFRPPQKVTPWTSVLKATQPLPPCFQQLPYDGKLFEKARPFFIRPWLEDCLHLNVWTTHKSPDKAPVIFFIHGGGFQLGSGTTMTDGSLMASEGMVVVSINYRLGPFGFLTLGIPDAPGNVGLMDQTLALQWVKDNAEVFGGDPDRITIAGISAGGASVGFHLLSPMSNGLFKRAITMSGVPTNWWAVVETDKLVKKAKGLMESLGCSTSNLNEALECLKQRHPEDIMDVCRTKTANVLTDSFMPTVDGEFLAEHPAVSVQAGRFNPADVMIGTTADEGSAFLLMINEDLLKTADGRVFRRDFLRVLRGVRPGLSREQLKTLTILYTNSSSSPDDPIMLRNAASDIYSDSYFDCHVNEFAEKMSAMQNHVYRYVYEYQAAQIGPFVAPRWVGALHGTDQAPLLAPAVIVNMLSKSSPQTVDVYRRFRNHFESFATNGDPNLEKEDYPDEPEWPRFDSQKQALHFGETSSVKPIRRQQQCAAWTNLIPLLDHQTCNA